MLLAVLASSAASADELWEPLENRIRPPGGVAAPRDEPTIGAPSPDGASQSRLSPPIGRPAPPSERSLFERFWMWLEAQARILPSVG